MDPNISGFLSPSSSLHLKSDRWECTNVLYDSSSFEYGHGFTGLDLAPFLAQEVNLTSAAANNGIQARQALNTHQSWDQGLPDYSCSKLVDVMFALHVFHGNGKVKTINGCL